MGGIGFVDDYIKIFKKDKEGLKGKFKILGQVALGVVVGATLYFHPEVTVRQEMPVQLEEVGERLQPFMGKRSPP